MRTLNINKKYVLVCFLSFGLLACSDRSVEESTVTFQITDIPVTVVESDPIVPQPPTIPTAALGHSTMVSQAL